MESGDAVSATLSTVKTYYELASDPRKITFLIQDRTSVQFLVYILEDKHSEIVELAVKTLWLLSEREEHCVQLSRVYGVTLALQEFISSCKREDVKVLASEVLARLVNPHHSVLKDSHNVNRTPSNPRRNVRKSVGRPQFLGSANCRAKTVALHIQGLVNHVHRKRCEDEFIKIRGVISITFDLSQSRTTLRVKAELDPQVLVSAISAIPGFRAQQVPLTDSSRDPVVAGTPSNKENVTAPGYFPEDDSPVKDKAVVDPASFGTKASGWINSATSFISKSFYW